MQQDRRRVLVLLALATLLAAPAPAQKQSPPAPAKTAAPTKKPAAAPVQKPAPPAPKPAAAVTRPAPHWSVAFSPDGTKVAVGGYKRVTVYDATTGQRLAQYVVSEDGVRALAYSADGKFLAAGGGIPGQSGTVTVLNAETGKPVRRVGAHGDTVEAVAFQGNLLLSAADDETVRLTDVASGKEIGKLAEHVGRCLSVAVPAKTDAGNGGNIFVTGGSDNQVKVWDAGFRRVVVNFDQSQGPIWCLAAFPQRAGRFAAGGGDGRIRFFGVAAVPPEKDAKPRPDEPAPRRGFQEREFLAHEGGVFALAPAPDESFLASGGADGRLVLWRLNGQKLREMAEAQGDIWGVAVSPDAKKVAAASLDGKTRVYDAEKGTLLLELPVPAPTPSETAAVSSKPGTGTGLRATYFGNMELSGKPLAVRVDPGVDFGWGMNGPLAGTTDTFSVRWEGFVEAPADGAYTFYARSDDGVRLWVNNKPVIDSWANRGVTEDAAPQPVTLKAGQRIPIRMEYFENNGEAEARLLWSYPGQEKQAIPAARLYPAPIAATAAAEAPKKK
jgi:FOG: WD40 repeat